MDGSESPSKIDLLYAEKRVIFLISDCSLDKRFSFYKLTRAEAEEFIDRLQFIEKLTWKQFAALDRNRGITKENRDTESFALVHEQNNSGKKLIEQYYFHFRVGSGTFRVFGYQKDQFFCITHIDAGGVMHHS